MESRQSSHRPEINCDLILGAETLTDPLTTILGYAQLLLKSDHLRQEERLQILIIEREARSLATKLDALVSTLSEHPAGEATSNGNGARPVTGASAPRPPTRIGPGRIDH